MKNIDDVRAAVRAWADNHPDGTPEQAIAAVGLPDTPGMRMIVAGMLARHGYDREQPQPRPHDAEKESDAG